MTRYHGLSKKLEENPQKLEDVVDQLDTDQDSVVNNKPEVITTTTEIISQESCAKLIGKSFMEATKSDAALISLGEWIQGNGKDQNTAGGNGCSERLLFKI